MVKRGPPLGMRVGGHRWPLSAIMLTVAGRRGRRVGGELSCDGLEDGEGGDEGVELGSGGLGGGEGGGEGGVLGYGGSESATSVCIYSICI